MNSRRKFISSVASAFLISISSRLMATDIINKSEDNTHDISKMPENWTKNEQIAICIS